MDTLETLLREPVSKRSRPNSFYDGITKLLDHADGFSELVPARDQARLVLLTGECYEIKAFMERQSQRIRELQAEIVRLETGLR